MICVTRVLWSTAEDDDWVEPNDDWEDPNDDWEDPCWTDAVLCDCARNADCTEEVMDGVRAVMICLTSRLVSCSETCSD